MPAPAQEPRMFSISTTGNFTGEKWVGKFQTKVVLSHRDRLEQDRLRREYLGARPQDASEDAQATALVFSSLAVHLVSWPKWWADSNMGMDLSDLNVVRDIYKAVQKAENDYLTELLAAAEEAKKTVAAEGARDD